MDLKNKKIVILGGGIVGLSTANRLVELHKGLDITIIAEKFANETTSDGAGGLLRPGKRTPLNLSLQKKYL